MLFEHEAKTVTGGHVALELDKLVSIVQQSKIGLMRRRSTGRSAQERPGGLPFCRADSAAKDQSSAFVGSLAYEEPHPEAVIALGASRRGLVH